MRNWGEEAIFTQKRTSASQLVISASFVESVSELYRSRSIPLYWYQQGSQTPPPNKTYIVREI
jgi:hypothetical protein